MHTRHEYVEVCFDELFTRNVRRKHVYGNRNFTGNRSFDIVSCFFLYIQQNVIYFNRVAADFCSVSLSGYDIYTSQILIELRGWATKSSRSTDARGNITIPTNVQNRRTLVHAISSRRRVQYIHEPREHA